MCRYKAGHPPEPAEDYLLAVLASCGDVPAPAFYRPGGPDEGTAWEGFELDFVLHLIDDGTPPAWEVTQGRFGDSQAGASPGPSPVASLGSLGGGGDSSPPGGDNSPVPSWFDGDRSEYDKYRLQWQEQRQNEE